MTCASCRLMATSLSRSWFCSTRSAVRRSSAVSCDCFSCSDCFFHCRRRPSLVFSCTASYLAKSLSNPQRRMACNRARFTVNTMRRRRPRLHLRVSMNETGAWRGAQSWPAATETEGAARDRKVHHGRQRLTGLREFVEGEIMHRHADLVDGLEICLARSTHPARVSRTAWRSLSPSCSHFSLVVYGGARSVRGGKRGQLARQTRAQHHPRTQRRRGRRTSEMVRMGMIVLMPVSAKSSLKPYLPENKNET